MTVLLDAAAPQRSAVVMASAGSGKTWLLITRIVRLLLDGVRPEGILAVTFTRKAAAEMQERLTQRLFALAGLEGAELDRALQEMGAAPNAELRMRAMRLYEDVLLGAQTVRITTFHAFCQDLLRRFPLDADVPPGFEVLDTTGATEQHAWEALCAQATAEPDSALATALMDLFTHCGTLHGAQSALHAFLQHRSDWWAYTEEAGDALDYALRRAAAYLGVDVAGDPEADCLSPAFCARLQEFAALLRGHSAAAYQTRADKIDYAVDEHHAALQRYTAVRGVLLKADGEPRAYPLSAALVKSLGAEHAQRLVELQQELCRSFAANDEQVARARTLRLTRAWLSAGVQFLHQFQRSKRERRWLDFADLEWGAYRLLNHADNAAWVQYKLDQRIDHVLVDEFQDTNPTQWRLLLPLLEELAGGVSERARSVFLVGDPKQSIYRFRRAEPQLLDTAAKWLNQHLNAPIYTLDQSRRSAPAIIDFVNRVFSSPALSSRIADFRPHGTHRHDLYGRVEVLPLVSAQSASANIISAQELRNPLQNPRVLEEDRRHYQEGQLIAARILDLLAAPPVIAGTDGGTRRVQPEDILILLRSRTHAHAYEQVLREAAIPFIGADRGTLLSTLEIRDLIAVLEILHVPFHDLALAQVLRSPLFLASDADLMQLARGTGSWMERLQRLAPSLPQDAALARALNALTCWQAAANELSVHELLDRIYIEGNVVARYEAAFPPALKSRVQASFTRFITLALEFDSEPYPSLAQFLARLRAWQTQDQDAPDETYMTGKHVRMLTIHAAKGLEAPVVFLADAAAARRHTRAFEALVNWPVQAARPDIMLLPGRKAELDQVTTALLAQQEHAQRNEDANLLYVALTRAQQWLFVSACAVMRGVDQGWYGIISASLQDSGCLQADGSLVIESTAHNRA